MTPGAGVLMLRRDHISHYGEYAISLLDTLIDIIFRDYYAAFL